MAKSRKDSKQNNQEQVKYSFFTFLIGDKTPIARAEILSVLGEKWTELDSLSTTRTLVFSPNESMSPDDVLNYVSECTKRSVLTHFSDILLGISRNIEMKSNGFFQALQDEIKNYRGGFLKQDQLFAVEVHRAGVHTSQRAGTISDRKLIEKKLGKLIETTTGCLVDLENPQTIIDVILEEEQVTVGIRLSISGRKKKLKHKTRDRPFFHSSSMNTALIHSMLNLAGVQPDLHIVDPFCGSGGFLIEGTNLNMKGTGIEVDKRMLWGAWKNSQEFNNKINLILGDARYPPFKNKSFDIMITDPPYGGTASTKGALLDDLLSETLERWKFIIRGNTVLCTPSECPIEEIATSLGYTIILGPFIWPVHRSLSRKIIVLRRCE